jgi:hypothetical protein
MKPTKSKQMSYRKGRLASPKVEKIIPSAQPFFKHKEQKQDVPSE